MNYSDQLCFVASALLPEQAQLAATLEHIAIGVRRQERALDEITRDAMEEEQLRQAALASAVVVEFPRHVRRVPIGGAA